MEDARSQAPEHLLAGGEVPADGVDEALDLVRLFASDAEDVHLLRHSCRLPDIVGQADLFVGQQTRARPTRLLAAQPAQQDDGGDQRDRRRCTASSMNAEPTSTIASAARHEPVSASLQTRPVLSGWSGAPAARPPGHATAPPRTQSRNPTRPRRSDR